MVRQALILFSFLFISFGIYAKEIRGTWSGELKITAQRSLKLVFNVEADSVTIDSPDQNAYGINSKVLYLSKDSLNVAVPRIGMDFSGKLINDSIKGTFSQGVFVSPLILTRGYKKAVRPQTPQPPFSYKTENITVKSPGAELAGTVTVPENATVNTPVVVLVSGSGLQNRDEELFGHKPFAVIADYLARNGIASFRYDDRGYGESKGDTSAATTADFASDAEAVINYFRSYGKFAKIGLIGHSEGGYISYMLGAKPDLLDFIISIAGPTVPGTEINAYQNKVALLNAGIDGSTSEDFREALLKALDHRLNNPPLLSVDEKTLNEIYPQINSSAITLKLAETISATLTMEKIQPWMEYFLRSNPQKDMTEIKIPSFIIFGEKDCQVPPSLCLKPAEEYMSSAMIKVYPGLNHLMQHAVTGSVEEYKEIEETISPEVLSDIVSFINSIK